MEATMQPVPVNALVSGHVGGFDLFTLNDTVTVMVGKRVLLKHKAPGLSDFLERNGGQVRLTLGRTDDFTIFGLWDAEGYGYALNLEDPILSEWGHGG
jgi:hypothetical protein